MVGQHGDLACCVRCVGPTAAGRLARRAVLSAAVHPRAADPQRAAPAARPSVPPGTGSPAASSRPLPAGPAPAAACPVLTGTVLDTSPHVVAFLDGDREQRVALSPDASIWRGRPADATFLEAGDSVVIRLLPGMRAVADRIWANAGRVTGLIVASDRDGLLVDEGRTASHQAVVIPPRAAGRLQVRFPRLEPGYLLDVIGLRHPGYLEAWVPATSQPAHRPAAAPAPGLARTRVAASIPGSASWHEPACAAEAAGVRYPALDPGTACLEHPLPGSPSPHLPYLSVGSLLRVRNECTGTTGGWPVSGCAATAPAFCDRCVTCGTSPRGRLASLPMASFVAMGGDLERGCFNATVSVGQPS